MAEFLTTTGINYHLEQLINGATERLVIISPYLHINTRIKELLEERNLLKQDTRIVYGKTSLKPSEISWFQKLSYIRTSYCDNLHAKIYLNEKCALITSLNLYQFSQVINNEAGVLINHERDPEAYSGAWKEAQRLIRISNEVSLSATAIHEKPERAPALDEVSTQQASKIESDTTSETLAKVNQTSSEKTVATTHIAQKHKMSNQDFLLAMVKKGFLIEQGDGFTLTSDGKNAGVIHITRSRFGPYFKWPENIMQ